MVYARNSELCIVLRLEVLMTGKYRVYLEESLELIITNHAVIY